MQENLTFTVRGKMRFLKSTCLNFMITRQFFNELWQHPLDNLMKNGYTFFRCFLCVHGTS